MTAPPLLPALHAWERSTPDADAVLAPDGVLSVRELLAEVDRAAGLLQEAGVGTEDAVGLCCGRSRWQVVALLATWRVGATAVLTDDRHPVGRTAAALRETAVVAVLGPHTAGHVVPVGARLLDLAAGAAATVPVQDRPVVPEACAYVVHTSGTTGAPKGVEITYASLASFLDALASLGLAGGGLGVNAVSPAFDGWLWCTLLSLSSRQGVALLDGAGGDLARQVAELRPATVSLTPSLLAACDPELPGTTTLVVAGEPCPPALLLPHVGRRRVLNVYGPTEATIAATWADSARGDDLTGIGRPLPGVRVHVLDDGGQPVAPGTPGELHLAGPALARGYRGQPGLTAAHFVAGPGGERVYATGDLVVERPDGQLAYAGRRDGQVKVRGVRVELDEVERVVQDLEGVRAAAAFLLPGGDALGVAVVPHDDGAGTTLRSVREHCATLLPDAMVPTAVHVLAALPVTVNGKADRSALASLPVAAALLRRCTGTETEELVCRVWDDLLPQPVPDVTASFFDLGGHSLLAARAVAALRRSTGLRVTLQQLLAAPTAAGLAATLDELAAAPQDGHPEAPAPRRAAGSEVPA